MNMWLHTRLIVLIVDRGGTLPDELKPRPERTPKRRVQALCQSVKVKDAILPALAATWERMKSGKPSRNELEASIYGIFEQLSAPEQEGLARGFRGYKAFRTSGEGNCLFIDDLAEKLNSSPPERTDFAREFMREGLEISSKQFFPNSGGTPSPGHVRPWKKDSNPVDSGEPRTEPWPWITAIQKEPGNIPYQFGNTRSFRPNPPHWEPFQYEHTCKFEPLATGGFKQACEHFKLPVPDPTGGMNLPIDPVCEGGPDYTLGFECLRIPSARAGDSIYLKGFNFISKEVDVHLHSEEQGVTRVVEKLLVYGDKVTPVNNDRGEVIVNYQVFDGVDVPIPSNHPVGSTSPFPPGLYELWVNVRDPSSPDTAPTFRASNKLAIRIEPDLETKFKLEVEGGLCVDESPGGGDDEIWWDVFVGHLVANEAPLNEQSRLSISITRVPVDRAKWKDVDQDDPVSSPTVIFGPDSIKVNGTLVLSVIGFEVDDEDAAREQLKGFSDGFTKAISELLKLSFDDIESASGIDFADAVPESYSGTAGSATGSLLITGHYAMAALVGTVAVISAAIWAVWAPADMIALDLFSLNAKEAWDKTDTNKDKTPELHRRFGEGTETLIQVTERPQDKTDHVGSVCTWKHHTQYDARDEGDPFSKYQLHFKLTRGTTL